MSTKRRKTDPSMPESGPASVSGERAPSSLPRSGLECGDRVSAVNLRQPWRVFPNPKERRLSLSLLYYWANLKSDDSIPRIDHVDPGALEGHWRHCCLLGALAAPGQWVLDYVGAKLIEDHKADPTGQPMFAINDGTLLQQISRVVGVVQRLGKPVTESGGYTDSEGQIQLFRSILLPFASFQGDVRYLLGAASLKPARPGQARPDHSSYLFDHAQWTFFPIDPTAEPDVCPPVQRAAAEDGPAQPAVDLIER